MAAPARAYVLFALHREARRFLQQCPQRRRADAAPCAGWLLASPRHELVALETGVGAQAAREALEWVAARERDSIAPPLVISAGFAGGLVESLSVGDVVCPIEVVNSAGRITPVRWSASVHVPAVALKSSRALTVDYLAATPREKQALRAQHNADVVDMESAVIAEFCADHSWSFGCVRAVSDTASSSLSPLTCRWLRRERASVWKVLLSIVQSPLLVRDAWRLASATNKAADALSMVLIDLLETMDDPV